MFTNFKILLAEDAKTMRRIEVKALNDLGFSEIVEANDGAEAIELIDESIDLIISDWNMPNMSGYEFLEWVRNNEKYSHIPFIMATAQSDKGHLSQAEDAGVSAFIAKPFANDELKSTIDRIFAGEEEIEEIARDERSDDGKVIIKVAHIQITDHLILGVLRDMIDKGDVDPVHFELETICMTGWNGVYNDLEKGKVNAACILAPMAMDLFHSGTPLKLILLAHRGGSIMVKSEMRDSLSDYKDFYRGSSFLIPHKMSIHHMLTDIFFKGIGLNPNLDKGDEYDIELEVVPPVHMAEFLETNPKNSGFMVAEPIGSQAVKRGIAQIEFYSNQLWENHPCCVFAARDEFLENEPLAAQEFVDLLVQAGQLITNDPDRASEIAVSFLDPEGKIGFVPETIKKIITDENGLKTADLYPNMDELNIMQDYMINEMGMNFQIDLESFVELKFADSSCKDLIKTDSLLNNSTDYIHNFLGIETPFEEENKNKEEFEKNMAEDIVQEEAAEDQFFKENMEVSVEEEEFEESMAEDIVQEETAEDIVQEETAEDQFFKENMEVNVEEEEPVEEIKSEENPVEEKVFSTESEKRDIPIETSLGGKYLTFSLGGQEYGINILKIKEIIGMMKINTLPQLPSHIKGVINLRNKVIPIMDLRKRFGMEEAEYDERTCIVIIEIEMKGEVKNVGLIVDSVSEVLPVDNDEVEKPAALNLNIETDFVLAMAKKKDSVKTLLNIEKIVN